MELGEWLQAIDPVFAFLLALPFLVVIAAILGRALTQPERRR